MSLQIPKEWKVHPHIGLGPLRFGQTRNEVNAILGNPTRVFKKVPFADNTTDAYSELSLHVFYDPRNTVESIDSFLGALVVFDGLQLIGAPVEQIVSELVRRGYNNSSLVFESAGIQLSESAGRIDGVMVFRPGYYDLANPLSAASRAQRAAEEWMRR